MSIPHKVGEGNPVVSTENSDNLPPVMSKQSPDVNTESTIESMKSGENREHGCCSVVSRFLQNTVVAFAVWFFNAVARLLGFGQNPPSNNPSNNKPLEVEQQPVKEEEAEAVEEIEEEFVVVAKELTDEQQQDARGLAKDIVQAYNALLEGDVHTKVQGEGGTALILLINKWREAFGLYGQCAESLAKEDNQVSEVEQALEQLQGLKKGVFYYSSPRIDENGIIRVPSDGNCLFYTAGLGVKTSGCQIPANSALAQEQFEAQNLREEVVKWMKEQYAENEELRNRIGNAIEAYKEAKLRLLDRELKDLEFIAELDSSQKESVQKSQEQCRKEQAEVMNLQSHEDYFHLVRSDGFFASEAELYAISEIYHVTIHIQREIDGRRIEGFDPSIVPAQSTGEFTVVHKDGNHFDLYPPIKQ